MILFGIDPGSTITGYGAIRVVNNTVSWADSGVIRTHGGDSLQKRLSDIYDGLTEKIAVIQPDRVCIEQAFYAKNVRTTLILGHARGVAMLAAHKAGAQVVEFSPREIKKAVVGNGNATKEQVVYMIKMLLSPPSIHQYNDAYDALATALCGFYRYNSLKTVYD
ncbi:MAG: crossover junction endodeoxyribonuclease RuvC [Chitinivibrionales bacterium]|nr:crossover junction endodeoxyribonuclease RuvC [Chitinivibrionales bacterium]